MAVDLFVMYGSDRESSSKPRLFVTVMWNRRVLRI